MKTKLLALAASGILATSSFAQASPNINVDGFIDIIYTGVEEAKDGTGAGGTNPTEGKFLADAEIDFYASLSDKVTVRVDLDFQLVTNGGANVNGEDSGEIEQAYFAAAISDTTTLLGGVFNNPIGWEAEDAPSLYQTSHSMNWNLLDGATTLHGNNVAGVALAADMGGVTVTGALLNDLAQANEENSIALVLNASPAKGLDLELGYVTQDTGAGDVIDINATYSMGALTFAAEILLADAVVDDSTMLLANYALEGGFGVTGRYEIINYASGADDNKLTVAGSYEAAKNLFVLAEVSDTDSTGSMFTLEFVAILK